MQENIIYRTSLLTTECIGGVRGKQVQVITKCESWCAHTVRRFLQRAATDSVNLTQKKKKINK